MATCWRFCDIDIDSGESSKLEYACELIQEIAEADEKAVIFSHKLAPLRNLSNRLKGIPGTNHTLISGEMDAASRNGAVSSFRENRACSVLLASMQVGAEGLTLTEANHVIFLNRWGIHR